jgi:uncharacterized protein
MKRAVWIFIAVTFAVTWGIVLGAYLAYRNDLLSLNGLNLVYSVGAIGPLAGAVVSASVCYGGAGIRRVFRTLRFRNVPRTPWLIALSPAAFFLIGLAIYPFLTGHSYSFAATARQFGLGNGLSYAAWILPFLTYSLLEEFGWRAYLLPHLQQKYPAWIASLVLTSVWAAWHLPFFLWRFDFSLFIGIGFFVALAFCSVVLTSLFNLARGSIVPVVLFHLMNNLASALEREYIVAVTGVGTVFLAIWLLRNYKGNNLSDTNRVGNFYKDHENERNGLHY